MMRLWMETYAEPAPIGSSAILSAVAHGVVIGLVVAGTTHAPERLKAEIAQRVQYLPPPDRVAQRAGPSETLHFIAMPATGKMGFDPTPLNKHPSPAIVVPKRGEGDRPIAVPVQTVAAGPDSVYSVLEVDSAVVRYADSAAPSYPPDLLAKNIQGTVYTEYIVDTSGQADTASLVILRSTHPEFTQAVREALPYMHFRPAKFGERKVKQLVQQQFTFRITPVSADTTAQKRTGRG